jgi:hypothetical protein
MFVFRAVVPHVPPKRRYLPTNPHGVTTQKTNIDIFTSVRTLKFITLVIKAEFSNCPFCSMTDCMAK